MIKIGLKLWNTNTDNYLPLLHDLYDKGYFDYIELYIIPNQLKQLPLWQKINIPFDIHAPHFQHNMNLSKKEYFKSNIEYYYEVAEFADKLKSNVIIFHGGTDGTTGETIRQLCAFNDSRTVIENKPYKVMPFINGNHYVGCTFKDIQKIIQNVRCNFCLDVCHALCTEKSLMLQPYSLFDNFLKLNPIRFHLSDHLIDEELDYHLNYGKGTIDFKYIISKLPRNSHITIETPKNSKQDLNDFISDVQFLKNIIQEVL